MTTQSDWFTDLSHAVRRRLGLPKDTVLPELIDLAGALPALWMREAQAESKTNLVALLKAHGADGLDALDDADLDMILVIIAVWMEPRSELPASENNPYGLWSKKIGTSLSEIASRLESVHEFWNALPPDKRNVLKHPIAPLIKAWFEYQQVLVNNIDDTNGNGTMPRVFAECRGYSRCDSDDEFLIGPIVQDDAASGQMAWAFADHHPALPVSVTARDISALLQGSRVLPMVMRLHDFLPALIPYRERKAGINNIEDLVTLDMLMPLTHPGGTSHWTEQRTRNIEQVAKGLRELRGTSIPMPGGPREGEFYPVTPHAIPGTDWDNNRPIPFSVYIPDGYLSGPRFNWQTLTYFGTVSAASYLLYKGLVSYWDKYGSSKTDGQRIFRRWSEPRLKRNAEGYLVEKNDRPIVKRVKRGDEWVDEPTKQYMTTRKGKTGKMTRILTPGAVPIGTDRRPVKTLAEAARVMKPAVIQCYPLMSLKADVVPAAYPATTSKDSPRRAWDLLHRLCAYTGAVMVDSNGYILKPKDYHGKIWFRVLPPTWWGKGYAPPGHKRAAEEYIDGLAVFVEE